MVDINKCKCGCGSYCKFQYVHGHNSRGTHLSEKAKRKLSIERTGSGNPMYGILGNNNPLTKYKISKIKIQNILKKNNYNILRTAKYFGMNTRNPIQRLIRDYKIVWNKSKTDKENCSIIHRRDHEQLGSQARHRRIRERYGKANKCELNNNHKSSESRFFHWSNINHKYSNNIKHWIQLCSRCHRLFDSGKIKKSIILEVIRNRKIWKK